MNGMPTMHLVAAGITALYGLISLTGGIMGYAKGSLPSLIAGGGAGVLLILCALGISRWPIPSLVVALVLALLLIGNFSYSLLTSELSSVRYAISIVMLVGGVAVLICGALALMAQPRPPTSL